MSEPAPGTAGALLRAARDRQGLHIEALAASIKVTQRKLEALENNRYDELPDATFTRALAQAVCRTLKIDPSPVLELLPPAPAATLRTAGRGLNTPFRDRPGREGPRLAGTAIGPMVGGAAVLLLAALVLVWAPDRWWAGRPVAAVAALGAASASAGDGPTAAAAPAAASAASEAAANALAAAPSATPSPPVAETVFSAPSAAAGAPAVAGILQLSSSEASWVEVKDARGQLLFSRTVLPGEMVGLDGSLPLRLTIGNAAATQLGFRGQPVDLPARTKDNVARFELQ